MNGTTILAGSGAIAWEATRRIAEPCPIAASTVLWVAVAGIVINLPSALFFLHDRDRDLNLRGVFLHTLGDAAVSAGVVGAAVVILTTGWHMIDPITAILVSVVVGWSAFGLLKAAIHLSLDGVPAAVDIAAVEQWLRSRPGVSDVHDLHVWPLSTTATALTAHLVIARAAPPNFLDQLAEALKRQFDIAHTTIQMESSADTHCREALKE